MSRHNMAIIQMLYVLPMLLGRTFDVRNDRVGVDLFPNDVIKNYERIDRPQFTSSFKMVDNSKDAKDFLDVSGDLSLKIKTGKLEVKGTGNYLKDTTSAGRNVEILTKLDYRTSIFSIPSNAQPLKDWQTRYRKEDLGTHYVKSVTYGGSLVASLQFIAKDDANLEEIKGNINVVIQGNSAFDLVAEGKLEKLQKELSGKASLEITYYATVPLKSVPNTIEGLRNLIRDFQDQVQETNEGLGVPMTVELVDLSILDPSRKEYLKNRALQATLEDLEYRFDDLRETKTRVEEWMRQVPPSIPLEQEKEISDLYIRINNVLRVFYEVLGSMDLEQSSDQFKPALEAYKEGASFALIGKFRKDFLNLRKKLDIIEERQVGTGTSTYIEWGSKMCSSALSTTLHSGYMAATKDAGVGGSVSYLCLPENPQLENSPVVTVSTSLQSPVNGVRYGLLDAGLPDLELNKNLYTKGVPCSLCHLLSGMNVLTIPAKDECPQSFMQQYTGYLMASQDGGQRTQYVCVRKGATYHEVNGLLPRAGNNLALVAAKPGALPADKYPEGSLISCVVCSTMY